MAEIGQPAPGFTLTGADGKTETLAESQGHVVVLAFYRGDDTPVCSRQLSEYAGLHSQLQPLQVKLFGISPDSPKSHYSFGCRLELPFPLLSDEDWAVARQYGVASRILGYGRAIFIVGADGVLKKQLKPPIGGLLTYTSPGEIITAVNEIRTA